MISSPSLPREDLPKVDIDKSPFFTFLKQGRSKEDFHDRAFHQLNDVMVLS